MKLIGVMLAALLLTGCGPKSSFGFRLPDGDKDAGQVAFVVLQCNLCHTVAGSESDTTNKLTVTLGGDVNRVRTYGELVTSIINPSHKISQADIDAALLVNGESAMESVELNHVMTVKQLVDLVAYLQPEYNVPVPQYDPYIHIYP